MKKAILVAVVGIAFMSLQACNDKKGSEKIGAGQSETTEASHDHQGHDHAEGDNHHADYRCEMDCEKGKTYHEPGKCPVCKMELIQVEGEGHAVHNH